jgi:hypothetical protein
MNFREFARYHRSYLLFHLVLVLALGALAAVVVAKRGRYEREIARLRGGMSEVERERTDLAIASEERRLQVMLALARRQARLDPEIHLAVSVDSGRMYLEREGAVLRQIPVRFGPERRVGTPPDTVVMATARGARKIVQILGADDAWQVPEWVYAERGLPVPSEREVKGALGSAALVLEGGTVIYSPPTAGPLNDPAYVMPGAVRAAAADIEAILPNLTPGTPVYFY